MRKTRRSRKQLKKRRRTQRRRYRSRGGALPIPNGSVASVHLDPKDMYGVPVLIRKEVYEEEIAEE
jgi:hypothetical protein